MSKFADFLNYFKLLRNPISCLLIKFGIKKEGLVKFRRSEGEVKVSNISTLDMLMVILIFPSEKYEFIPFIEELESKKEVITILNNVKIYNPIYYKLNRIFQEYYTDSYYDFDIDFKDRIIIDIGANAGDTALYFASEGAEVFAFEPVKEYFEMAKKNFELNHKLKEKIHIYNYGVSYKKGKLNINVMDSVSDYIEKNDSYDVEIITIEDILKKIQPDLLKIDCEGCEFEIIKNTDLSMFNELIFEYHSEITGKDYKELIEILELQGFKTEIFSVFNTDKNKLGMIHAYKL